MCLKCEFYHPVTRFCLYLCDITMSSDWCSRFDIIQLWWYLRLMIMSNSTIVFITSPQNYYNTGNRTYDCSSISLQILGLHRKKIKAFVHKNCMQCRIFEFILKINFWKMIRFIYIYIYRCLCIIYHRVCSI